MSTRHRVRTVLLPPHMRDTAAEIDEALAPLIRRCWQLGLRTVHSCEGDLADDRRSTTTGETPARVSRRLSAAYITFRTPLEALVFLGLAGPASWPHKWVQERDREARRHPNWWNWDWSLDSLGSKTVRFPREDVPRATRAVQAATWKVGDLIHDIYVEMPPSAPPTFRICRGCGEHIPPSLRSDAVYHSRRCQLQSRSRKRPQTESAPG